LSIFATQTGGAGDDVLTGTPAFWTLASSGDDPAVDPFADITQAADGALVTYADDSSIPVLGGDATALNATNLSASDLDAA
jgi:hypothetical protein